MKVFPEKVTFGLSSEGRVQGRGDQIFGRETSAYAKVLHERGQSVREQKEKQNGSNTKAQERRIGHY